MRCSNCGAEVPGGRAFCAKCGTAVAPSAPPPRLAGRYDDVVTVDLAAVPPAMRAPTVWQIAQGVALGLFLFGFLASVLGGVLFVVGVSFLNR